MADTTPTATAVTDPNNVVEIYIERVMAHQSADNIILTFMVERLLPGHRAKPTLVVTARLVMHYSAANDLLAQMQTLCDGIALHESETGSAH